MKSKLAILLAAVLGFSMATVVFAQDAMKAADTTEVANTEMNEANNEAVAEDNTMAPADAAPDMNAEVPPAPAANTEAPSAPASY